MYPGIQLLLNEPLNLCGNFFMDPGSSRGLMSAGKTAEELATGHIAMSDLGATNTLS